MKHAFQAAKATNQAAHDWVWQAPTAYEAKQRGRSISLRPDWEQIKDEVMLRILRAKFALPRLRKLLLGTGDQPLVEDRPDPYWGRGLDGKGKNMLGILLVEIRAEIRTATGTQTTLLDPTV